MSNLLEILALEQENHSSIYFYREGVFYKAYEQSAYLFVHHIKPFQIKKRYVKSVKREVISVGFPTNSLYNYFSKEKVTELEICAKVDLDKMFDLAEFEQWKNSVPLMEELPKNAAGNLKDSNNKTSVNVTSQEKNVVTQIRMFRPVIAYHPPKQQFATRVQIYYRAGYKEREIVGTEL